MKKGVIEDTTQEIANKVAEEMVYAEEKFIEFIERELECRQKSFEPIEEKPIAIYPYDVETAGWKLQEILAKYGFKLWAKADKSSFTIEQYVIEFPTRSIYKSTWAYKRKLKFDQEIGRKIEDLVQEVYNNVIEKIQKGEYRIIVERKRRCIISIPLDSKFREQNFSNAIQNRLRRELRQHGCFYAEYDKRNNTYKVERDIAKK